MSTRYPHSMSPAWFPWRVQMGTYKSKNVKRKMITKGDWFLIGFTVVLVIGIVIGSAWLGRMLANV